MKNIRASHGLATITGLLCAKYAGVSVLTNMTKSLLIRIQRLKASINWGIGMGIKCTKCESEFRSKSGIYKNPSTCETLQQWSCKSCGELYTSALGKKIK
jgi:transposase-like protein|tara:strand:- start:534 stop:833 length:300 start_codon:yes stop_codon:yes gene_type:complete